MDRTTTDLETVRQHPGRFPWGPVQQIHDIGPYTIVEFLTRGVDPAEGPSFHVYVDGKSTNHSTDSLDSALLVAIGRKNCEANEGRHMAEGAMRLFGIKE